MAKAGSKLETVVVKVVAKLWAESLAGGPRVGIMTVGVAVEEAMGRDVELPELHAAVLKTCEFWVSDDPRCPEAYRQAGCGYQPPGTTERRDRLVWVLPRQ